MTIKKQKIKVLSLFANVGVGEARLSEINHPTKEFEVVVANELLKDRCDFYSNLYPSSKIIHGDITQSNVLDDIITTAVKEGVTMMIATPPCQGMSQAGRMSEDDPRNSLILKAMECFEEIRPQYMLIENVPQMLRTYISIDGIKVKIIDYLSDFTKKLGYQIKYGVFDASLYGTPQSRKRCFVRIYKDGLDWVDPPPQKKISVRDKIGMLPTLEAGQKSNLKWHNAKDHNAKHVLWMKNTPTGKTAFENEIYFPSKDGRKISGFATTYKRIEWDVPAPTITMANGSVSSQNNVHPGRKLEDGTYSDARVLTILELLRLSGLPDDWNIPEGASDSLIRKVIGEAVPPYMMKTMVESIV